MCPLLQSCSFGYHAGGWGKPLVDETGKPLYGDVFGTNAAEFQVWVDCLVSFYSVLERLAIVGLNRHCQGAECGTVPV